MVITTKESTTIIGEVHQEDVVGVRDGGKKAVRTIITLFKGKKPQIVNVDGEDYAHYIGPNAFLKVSNTDAEPVVETAAQLAERVSKQVDGGQMPPANARRVAGVLTKHGHEDEVRAIEEAIARRTQ